MSNFALAFALTVFAGLATAIGSAIAFAARRTNYRFLSVATGFSAGVMLYVSFVELLHQSAAALLDGHGDPAAYWWSTGSFFVGIVVIGLIDQLIPAAENPHESRGDAELGPLHANGVVASPHHPPAGSPPGLMKTGLVTAAAITIHNFPEGIATFLAALHDPTLGAAIAVAIAVHNIPEGISVSVPIFYATGNRRKAWLWSALSGLAEPLGALIAYLALRLVIAGGSETIPSGWLGLMFGAVAGVMVYISLDELLPTSRAYGRGHDSLLGLVAGMAIMAISLLLMR